MTAKEKAKELVDKFLNEQNNTEEISEAKQCALICVDEILRILPFTDVKYWQEVKQEINKL
jgi:homoserine trans-succinylase